MSFPEAIKTCFRKYGVFKGRASRPEFWWFVLLTYAVLLLPLIVYGVLEPGPTFEPSSDDFGESLVAVVVGFAGLALILPNVAVTVRRLHDTGKSGWWYFIALIPFGGFVLIVFLASEGQQVWNQYGAPPGLEGALAPTSASLPPPPPMPRV